MTFNKEDSKVPAAIGDISVVLTDYSGTAPSTAHFEVRVLEADGNMFGLINGDLVPHLTPAQISGLMDFMADMRAKAESEIL